MHTVAAFSRDVQASRSRRQPLRVPGLPSRAYFFEQDADGELWLMTSRRSAPDEHGRQEVLREPELSWCFAEAAVLAGLNACVSGVRVDDRSTNLVYELGLEDFLTLAILYMGPNRERQLRVPLRLWRIRPSKRPVPSMQDVQDVQLSLFAAAEALS